MGEQVGFRWIFLLFAVAMMGFIWQQSTVPTLQSAEISDTVRDVVVDAVGGEAGAVGSFVDRFVRKIAHFVEFFLLGICVESYFLGRYSRGALAARYAIGGFVAAADETVQIFTGRGASVLDVLLDFSGFVTASLLLMAASYGITLLKKRKVGADPRTEQRNV